MSGSPRVSVILATFRRRDYLVEALGSALDQRYDDLEVIVGNDGGPEHIDPVKARFPDERIVWVDHRERKGLFGNTLDGLSRARGTYCALLQDDDRWSPEMLSTLVPPLDADTTLTVAFSDHYVIDGDGAIDLRLTERVHRDFGRAGLAAGRHQPFRRMAAVMGTVPVQVAAVFRRDAVDVAGFPVGAGTKFDRWLAAELSRGDAAAWYEPTRLAYYRSHAGQQTATGRLENSRSGIYIYERFLSDPEMSDLPVKRLQALLAEDHYGAAVSLLRHGDATAGRHHLIESLRLHRRPRAGLAYVASYLPRAVVTRL